MKLFSTLLITAVASAASLASVPAYRNAALPVEERIEDALSRMTLREKINLIHAQSKFSSPGVARLGIPGLWTTDGPHGIRPEVKWDEWDQAGWTNDSCVAFPALTCLAATWNPHMAALYGKSIGEEALYRGKNVLLGPGVNIYRTPLNGRNFEYMGEDPLLAARMVVPYVRGVQEQGVATCVKHYALNNNEVNRHTTNVILDDRTLYEIYLPAFKAAVQQGGAWSIMGAYNLCGDEHLCHNNRFLNKILKDEWGFDGAVISDWGGVHNTDQAIANGVDLEFGSWTNGLSAGARNAYDMYFMALPYLQKIQNGEVGTRELDEKVRRVLRLIFRTSMNPARGVGEMCSEAHYAAARQIGSDGIVLLKNARKVLPVRAAQGGRILVVGENAVKKMTVGGGSSSLKVQREVSPLEGIRAAAPDMTVEYARGYVGDTGGEYNGVVTGQDLKDGRSAAELVAEAVEMAKGADYVIFVGGLNKADHQDCEDTDRTALELPYGQNEVIAALAAVNPNMVVVNISGNAVAMPWVNKVPAIVQGWYLGSEAGNSLADVLFGKVNPSGRLPFTFPVALKDNGAHALGAYPGVKRADSNIVDLEYKEGILVGYRWHDTKKVKPLFAFGHGLSYTAFEYGKVSADSRKLENDGKITVSVPVTNTGSIPGAEVVQLYVSDPRCSVLRPAKELKHFSKVYLQPGETKTVAFSISRDDLGFFDAASHSWVVEPGEFIVSIGSSSDNIKGKTSFTF